MSYQYNDSGYKFLSLHRKVLEYDPRNTDNLIILDYFNTMRRSKDDVSVYYKLIELELNKYAVLFSTKEYKKVSMKYFLESVES